MSIINPPKALIALVALICLTVLMASNRIEGEAAMGLMGMIIGYAVGNGIAAKSDEEVQPIIGKKNSSTFTKHEDGSITWSPRKQD